MVWEGDEINGGGVVSKVTLGQRRRVAINPLLMAAAGGVAYMQDASS